MSARLSNSLPKAVSVPISRATRPSRPSKIMATKIAMVARSKLPSMDGDDRVEAAEQAAGRQQVWQQEDPAAHANFVEIDFHASGVARPGGSA